MLQWLCLYLSTYSRAVVERCVCKEVFYRAAIDILIYKPSPSRSRSTLSINKTRTQIVNELDASVVSLNLDLYPGCVVVESGTGSGCMTLAMARAVYPNGHVHTYEYNGVRAQTAVYKILYCMLLCAIWCPLMPIPPIPPTPPIHPILPTPYI